MCQLVLFNEHKIFNQLSNNSVCRLKTVGEDHHAFCRNMAGVIAKKTSSGSLINPMFCINSSR